MLDIMDIIPERVIKMYYQESIIPRISDFDRYGRLSYTALLHLLENIGSRHSDHVNDNILDGSGSGIAWILTDWRLHIERLPDDNGELLLKTWGRGKAPSSIVYRDFTVQNSDGETIVAADSKFALLDLANGKLTKISRELFDSYGPEEETVFDSPIPRLREPAEFEGSSIVSLRRSDIDFNGHMHNSRYLDIALEVLPAELCGSGFFGDIHIVYRRPVKEGSEVALRYTFGSDGGIIGLFTDDTLCSLIELKNYRRP